jgi:hypothetical protein
MGFFSNVVHAVTAPVTSTVAAVQNVAKGNVGGALSAAWNGTKDVAAPVAGALKATYVDATSNFISGGVGAAKGIVAGDWRRTLSGAAQAVVAPTNIATAEGATSNAFNDGQIISPTGYGAIAYGDTSSEAYKKAAMTTAIIAGGAYAGGGFAGSTGGAAPEATSGVFGSGVSVEQAAGAVAAAGGVGAAGAGSRKPASTSLSAGGVMGTDSGVGLSNTEKLIIGGVAVAAILLILRRK